MNAGSIGRPIHTSDYGKNFGITRGMTWVGGAQYTYPMTSTTSSLCLLSSSLVLNIAMTASRTRCL